MNIRTIQVDGQQLSWSTPFVIPTVGRIISVPSLVRELFSSYTGTQIKPSLDMYGVIRNYGTVPEFLLDVTPKSCPVLTDLYRVNEGVVTKFKLGVSLKELKPASSQVYCMTWYAEDGASVILKYKFDWVTGAIGMVFLAQDAQQNEIPNEEFGVIFDMYIKTESES